MKSLQVEHRGLRQLLALLQCKLQRLEQGDSPDFNLIEDTINYIENYLERYHHPKEDIIYQYIIKHNLDSQGKFAKAVKEHSTFKQLTQPLRTTLQSILLDIIIPNEVSAHQLKTFIEAQQSHVDYEDNYIFPLIEQSLSDKQWAEISLLIPKQEADPLFGEHVHAEYNALYLRLRDMETN